tara:strand:- start:1494 stop:2003 length:510 start_codon:yes stop_codon:yes gene_type:complete
VVKGTKGMKKVQRHRYKDKEIFETRTLTFEAYNFSELNMCLVMGLIQKNITPDLLKGRKKLMYPDDVKTVKYYGHCYHASQALYYLIETDKLVPMSGEDYRGEKHWWLQCGDNIYDCTAEQYYTIGKLPPYHNGKKTAWYGWKQRPQQVSFELMKRVLTNRLESDIITK